MENKDLKNGLYIPSIEACWLYKENVEKGNYEVKDEYLKKMLKGKIDWSYELAMNTELVNNIEIKEIDGKLYTLDIINVKYKNKYKNKKENISLTGKQLRHWSYIGIPIITKFENKLKKKIEVDKDKLKVLIKNKELYKVNIKFNGKFILNWKRSGGKARGGDNLFMVKNLVDPSLDWARMDLKYKGKVDIAGSRAYESLPLSSIMEELIEINPKNILVIDDYESKFPWVMSKTWLEKGKLETKTMEIEESNSIWDGEGLLSKKIFDKYEFLKGKGVALLRNRLTKCAGFNCDIEKFYKDYCTKNNLDYETFEVEDIAGNKIKVKNIELITTPSSLKIKKNNKQVLEEYKDENGNNPYKTNDPIKDKNAWLNFFRDNADSLFGVAKVDKPSHLEDGKYQRTSYQMINTIPFTKDEIHELLRDEIKYINRLKSDLNFFMQEINNPIEDNTNSDSIDEDNRIVRYGNSLDVTRAIVELVKKNCDFQNTQVFKDYRRNFIKSYVDTIREGKVKIEGDYCVACGNPIEMLYATVGEFKGVSLTLVNNELYCARFGNENIDIIGFRNPHINVGNVGIQVNKYNEDLEKYMKCTNNIVFLNSIDYPILSTYQGEDFDIDSNLLTSNPIIVEACKRIDKNKISIPVNRIKNTGSNNAIMNGFNMANIDHTISQNYIGKVINLSQEVNSIMNHLINTDSKKVEYVNELYDRSSKCSSISQCEIDKAKKQFEELNVFKEIVAMNNDLELIDDKEVRELRDEIQELKLELKLNKDDEFTKKLIKCKKDELKQYDSRRLKPYFFKFVGDNEAKKSRRKVKKAYMRKLMKDDGINIDKATKEQLKAYKEMTDTWYDKQFRYMETPMDWLEIELNSIKNKTKSPTVHMIDLVKKSKHKANEELVKEVKSIIVAVDKTVTAYRSDTELEYKDRNDRIKAAKEETVTKIKEFKIKKADISKLLIVCLNSYKKNGRLNNKTGIESIALEILFMTFGSRLFDMFIEKGGDSQEKKVV